MHITTLVDVHKEAVMDLLIIQETGCLVTCSLDGTIKFWNQWSGKSIDESQIIDEDLNDNLEE